MNSSARQFCSTIYNIPGLIEVVYKGSIPSMLHNPLSQKQVLKISLPRRIMSNLYPTTNFTVYLFCPWIHSLKSTRKYYVLSFYIKVTSQSQILPHTQQPLLQLTSLFIQILQNSGIFLAIYLQPHDVSNHTTFRKQFTNTYMHKESQMHHHYQNRSNNSTNCISMIC